MSDLIDNAQNVRRWLDEKGQHEKADAVSALVIAYQTLKNAKPAEQQEATCKQSLQVAAATKAGGDEPVAWAVTYNGAITRNIFETKFNAETCCAALNQTHPRDSRSVIPLFTRPQPQAEDKAGGDEPFLFIYFDPTAGTHGSHRVAETHPPPADAFPVYTRPQPQGGE